MSGVFNHLFVIFLLFRKIFIWLYHVKYEVSDTIYGEGPVIFDYLPLSDNTNKDRLSGETLVNESNDGAYYWGVSLFNPDPNKYTARFSRVSLNFDILKTTSSYVDVATKDNLNSHGINGYAHGSFVRCVRSN